MSNSASVSFLDVVPTHVELEADLTAVFSGGFRHGRIYWRTRATRRWRMRD